MTSTNVPREVLMGHLEEQLEFIKNSCSSYDSGFEGEIKRLAVTVRVLVHDTKSSTSLLSLLGMKGVDFVDTAFPFVEENQLSHSSLVQIHHTKRGTVPKAHLDGGIPNRSIKFDAWWNGIVFVDGARNEFSRKDIVLTLANQEGGAHVDSRIDLHYQNLRKHNSLGWVDVFSDGKQVPGADQVPATMRQIGHEILKTLIPDFAAEHPKSNETLLISMGASMTVGSAPPEMPQYNLQKKRPTVNSRKIGRNDPCVCGSEKKYKHCCINK